MWSIRPKILTFLSQPHIQSISKFCWLRPQIYSVSSMSHNFYLSHLRLKYYHILPGQITAIAYLLISVHTLFPESSAPVILSNYSDHLYQKALYDLVPINSLTHFLITLSLPYYAIITLVFLLLLQHAKHVPTWSPIQLLCPQPRTFSPNGLYPHLIQVPAPKPPSRGLSWPLYQKQHPLPS